MRNPARCFGVYSNMLRIPLFLVCSLAAVAQMRQQQDPLDTAIQAVWQARSSGQFGVAAAAREQARALLQRAPADSPRFAGWVQQVSQFYQSSSLNGQARAILQDALARTSVLGDSNPSHIAMLNALGESWRQDGNLLKAVGYLEQAAAAQAKAPPLPPAQSATGAAFSGKFSGAYFGGGYTGNVINAYTRLADLYRQLGRPDAVAAIAAKIRTLAANDQNTLARFYEQHGQFDEAASIYKQLAEQAADPQTKGYAWQSLANVYASQEDYAGATAAIQQAIAAMQSSDNPGIRGQAVWMRQNLTNYMRQAGELDQADQVYRQLLQESRGAPQESQMLGMYANYLADTKRGAQGETLLQDYLASGSPADPQEKANILFNLSNVARRTGDDKSGDEYAKAAQALQPPPTFPAGQIRIGEEMQQAQAALNQHRWNDAYDLALRAMDGAPQAVDGQQVEWSVPQVAYALAANKEPAKAEQLFQRLFALAQTWKVDSMQPLITVTQAYEGFLTNQRDRRSEAPAAIEQYRSALIDANGSESGSLLEPLRMRIAFEQSDSQWANAQASARDLLEWQESLSGNSSDFYLADLQTAARLYEASGDSARALPLLRKAIGIADLLDTPNSDWRRSQTRMEAAMLLARMGQFDEAETLGAEAVALQRPMRTPNVGLSQQLEQIRQMKRAAATASR